MTTYAEICSWVREADPNLEADREEFRVAALLLASTQLGTDPLVLAEFTGENAEWIAFIGSRWNESGIWTADGMVAVSWIDNGSPVDFWLDVLVGTGMMTRAPVDDDG